MNILFISGTRADFGKIKSVVRLLHDNPKFNVTIFVTGMHMLQKYGLTKFEVSKEGFNCFEFYNQNSESSMEQALSATIDGLSKYLANKL